MAINSPFPQSQLKITMRDTTINLMKAKAKHSKLTQGEYIDRILRENWDGIDKNKTVETIEKNLAAMQLGYNQMVELLQTNNRLTYNLAKRLDASEQANRDLIRQLAEK